MNNWYAKIFQETDDIRQLSIICQACEYYEKKLPTGFDNVKPPKGPINALSSKIPSYATENLSIIGDLNIMLKHLENQESIARTQRTQYYMEHYQRKLSETVAKAYADSDQQVQAVRTIRFRVASVMEQFMAISRGLEYMHYQIGNIGKMRVAGIEDAEF